MKKFLLLRGFIFFLLLTIGNVFGIKNIDFVNCYRNLISQGDIETHSDEFILNEINFNCEGHISSLDRRVAVDIIRRMDFIEKNTNYRIESKINQGLEKVIFKTMSYEVIILFFDLRHRDDRFNNEINFLTTLDHDNIIKIRDINCEQFYFVQDLASMDFLDFIDKARCEYISLYEDILIGILKDIISGLSYLRRENIVHRDIKPENILLFHNIDGSYTAKIIDFSFAVKIPEGEDNICLWNLSGSLFYAPPVALNACACGRSYYCSDYDDIYAFGVVLYTAFYKKSVGVFYKEQHQKLCSSCAFMFFYIKFLIKGLRPSLDNGYLADANRLIDRCWKTDKSLRPSSEEIYSILDEMLN